MPRFHSVFFKIAVLNELVEAGKLPSFFKELEKKCVQWQKAQIKAKQDALHPDLLTYINEFEISDADLNSITRISFEGGNDIYQLIWPEWDGADDLFLVRDFRDVQLLPNLEEILHVILCHIEDASPLLALTKLKKLDIDYGYGITDQTTIEKLKARGVEILSEETVENETEDSAKEVMFVDNFNHAYDLLWEDENAEDALEILEDLLRLKPEDFDCWLEKGNALAALERFEEAEQAWLQCFQIDPENATINYNLANAMLEKADYAKALEFIETAIQQGMDTSAEAYHVKAQLLNFLQNKTLSIQFFELALKFYKDELEEDERNDEVLFQMACVCNCLGNIKDALQYLKKAISLDRSNALRARNDKDLKSLASNSEFLKIVK